VTIDSTRESLLVRAIRHRAHSPVTTAGSGDIEPGTDRLSIREVVFTMKRVGLLLVSLTLLMMVPMASAQGADTTVAVAESADLGSFLTDAEGMTLYLFTKDEPGISNCTGDCLANWPALTVEEDAELTLPEGVPGTLDVIEREDDGTYQVTYNGWPLYYWVGDTAAGDTTGQGVGDVWFVIEPAEETTVPGASPEASPAAGDSTVLVSEDNAELGPFLTDAEGMTLYLYTKDTEGTSTCVDNCLENWPAFVAEDPLTLPEGVPGELTQIERPDGSMQVAYNGMPLYYYIDDVAAGDVTGQAKGEVWYVVAPEE
jgi:predicted lipoprotein with Yx(FWY)xxD motif